MTQLVCIEPDAKPSLVHRIGCAVLILCLIIAAVAVIVAGSLEFSAEQEVDDQLEQDRVEQSRVVPSSEVEEEWMAAEQQGYARGYRDGVKDTKASETTPDPVPLLNPGATRDEAGEYELRLSDHAMKQSRGNGAAK